jgi:hypothetical protein
VERADAAQSGAGGGRARVVLVVAGLWVLLGAVAKLFWGTPGDLPELVRALPLGLALTFRLAISLELAVAFLALIRPRWAWLPMLGLLLAFVIVLVLQIGTGASSCGCFGAALEVPPWIPLVIDGALLLLLVATRPWRGLGGAGFHPALLVPALLLSVTLPWALDREAREPGAGADFAVLDVARWQGLPIRETDLARWFDVETAPQDGLWVLYRDTCEDCRDHLEHLSLTDTGERPITLIRLAETKDTPENRVIQEMPEGAHVHHVTLPTVGQWVMTAPAELELEGGRVVRAEEGIRLP